MMDARLSACTGKAMLILTAVFMGGLVLGVLGTRVYNQQPDPLAVQHAGPLHSQQAELSVTELRTQLDLNEEQVAKIHMILDESIMDETNLLDQLQALQTEARRRILELLDEKQRAKFHVWSDGIAER